MTFRKMVNRPDPVQSLASKVESGVQLFGALKTAYDVSKTLAPYVARGIAMLA